MNTVPSSTPNILDTAQQQERAGNENNAPIEGSGILTLQQIMEREFSEPPPVIDRLLYPNEVVLFFARQKEGKSTLALQFAIDVACGAQFLGRYETAQGPVLYVDYENRPVRLKTRGLDLTGERRVENLYVKTFDRVAQRDVGLFGREFEQLKELVQRCQPTLLIIDPLRYAGSRGRSTAKEEAAMEAIDRVSKLFAVASANMSVVLVHHAKRSQDKTLKVRLSQDPRTWIEEQAYGSQALLAHVDNIWGLESEDDGYVFATVPRAQEPLLLRLEKQPGSERFLLGALDETIFNTGPRREAWKKLPSEFGWREATKLGISNKTLDKVIRTAMTAGLLTQDPASKKYRKVESKENV